MKPEFRVVGKEYDGLLPLKGVVKPINPRKLKYLLIGEPKWGKTTFFSGCPNCCLLAFEAGYAEVDCPKVVITSWDRPYKEKKLGWDIDEDGIVYTSATEAVEEMENNCPYEMVIIDTIDIATKMASDYHCKIAGVDHPSEGGKYGRGWDILQTRPVRIFYNRLVKLGVGVAAITHTKEKVDERFSDSKPKKETSLPGGVQHFIHTQSDCIMHGMRARRRKGQRERDRYINFDGSSDLMAGTRIRKVYIPNKYIVDPPTRTDDSIPWKQWESFFTNNPTAGKAAEENFVRLYRGLDDEYLAAEQTEKKDKT
jgi:AAA domain